MSNPLAAGRRILFPRPRASARSDELHDLQVLLLVAILSFGAPVREMLLWGPAQGCRFVFAGLGFGCGHVDEPTAPRLDPPPPPERA